MDFTALAQLIDLGLAAGIGAIVKIIVEIVKRFVKIQGATTLTIVFGCALAFSVAALFALPQVDPILFKVLPWGIALLKGIFTGIVAAGVAVLGDIIHNWSGILGGEKGKI